KLDVLRLGALCGPPHGLLTRQPALRADPEQAAATELTHLERGECDWAAVGTAPPRAVELQWVERGRLLTSCEVHQPGWCPTSGPLCADSPSDLELSWDDTVDATLVLQIWRRDAEPT